MRTYRVTYERNDAAVIGSHDMTIDYVETVHKGSVISAWIDSAGEFLLTYSRVVSWEIVDS